MKEPLEEYKYKDLRQSYRSRMPELHSKINCPSCNNEVGYADINIDRAIAKCSECSTVFSFDGDNTPIANRNKPEVFQPEGIEILHLMSELVIDFKWRKTKPLSGFVVMFAIIWNAILLPFIISAVLSGQFIMLLMISLHLAVGLGFIVHIITTLFNTTYITVDDKELAIENRPIKIPFVKDHYISVDKIEQLYVKKYVASRTNGVANYAFSVNAKLRGQADISIIKGLKKENKALYIEQEIELYLDIKDQAVKGEH